MRKYFRIVWRADIEAHCLRDIDPDMGVTDISEQGEQAWGKTLENLISRGVRSVRS